MAQITAFHGIRYGKKLAASLADLAAPPYDVLSKEQVAQLHAQSEFNITHLTRPTSYQSAGELWRKWRSEQVVESDAPSLYIYSQTFTDPETHARMPMRLGLVCALTLEDYATGGVLPHENTIAAHRADRLELMRATRANLESIFGLYSDPKRAVLDLLHGALETAPQVGNAENMIGSSHTLRQVTDHGVITALQQALADRSILIADGHHRYETALAYRREHPDLPGANAILITLTAYEDAGLLVLPTHRLVRGISEDLLRALPEKLAQTGFDVSEVASDASPLPPGSHGFDMLLSGGTLYRCLLPEGAHPATLIRLEHSDAWKSLDVSILSALVFEGILGIPIESLATTDQVRYTRDCAEARASVADGAFQAAFLLSRPTMAGIDAVSAAGEKMPQKSTFFYPKLLSGLVMRSLEE